VIAPFLLLKLSLYDLPGKGNVRFMIFFIVIDTKFKAPAGLEYGSTAE